MRCGRRIGPWEISNRAGHPAVLLTGGRSTKRVNVCALPRPAGGAQRILLPPQEGGKSGWRCRRRGGVPYRPSGEIPRRMSAVFLCNPRDPPRQALGDHQKHPPFEGKKGRRLEPFVKINKYFMFFLHEVLFVNVSERIGRKADFSFKRPSLFFGSGLHNAARSGHRYPPSPASREPSLTKIYRARVFLSLHSCGGSVLREVVNRAAVDGAVAIQNPSSAPRRTSDGAGGALCGASWGLALFAAVICCG